MGASHCFDGCTDARIRVPQKGIKEEEKGTVDSRKESFLSADPLADTLIEISSDRVYLFGRVFHVDTLKG